jgi:hypothetical protein
MKPAATLLAPFRLLLVLIALAPGAHADDSISAAIGNRAPTAILRVMPDETPKNQQLDGHVFLASYEVIGEPVPIPADRAAELVKLVATPTAFALVQKDDRLRPGVAYRFGSGADAVDLLVCFSCDKVAVAPAGAEAITGTHRITQPARDVLLGLAKTLLPGDEAIQELPKVRGTHPVPPPAVPIPKDAPRPGQSAE